MSAECQNQNLRGRRVAHHTSEDCAQDATGLVEYLKLVFAAEGEYCEEEDSDLGILIENARRVCRPLPE